MVAIILENLWKWYRLGFTTIKVLNGIDLRVEDGEVLCVLGPNGAGKTTLLKIIAGVLRPDRGRVEVYGMDPYSDSSVKDIIGFMPQEEVLLQSLTFYEHVELLSKAKKFKIHKQFINELIDIFNFKELVNRKPLELSMGQRKLMQLLLSLIHKPKLLLLDEPTAYLDQENRLRVLNLIKKLNELFNVTIIVTTHDPQTAQFFSNKMMLRDGKLITV